MAGGDESHTNIDELQVARAGAVELVRGVVLAGRYEVEAALGRGGAGVVLRAHDRELREAVAIKVLRPELGQAPRWTERLAREVKLARQLRHPNVCRVFDFEKADGHVFIVMELATGGSLRRELDEQATEPRAARSPEERLADARAVVAGLAAIHDAGIAHRDVTPQNVLRMADGRLVVSDFGLATEVSQTTTSVHGGTVAYMAPEIVRGQRGTYASDVWALGVVIHEIVFGARPTWSKPVGGAILTPVLGRTLAKAERLAYDVCRACTAEAAGDRPKTAGEVAAWLEAGRRTLAPRRRTVARAALAAILIATLVSLGAARRRAREPDNATSMPAIADRANELRIEGHAADWTTTSKVLATIPDVVRCLTVLPDRRTLRFVWKASPQAEDLDVRTGRRRPSALVPKAFKDGCPELSPDGKRLLFQGYGQDGRAFAFVSEHPDGRDAVPVHAIGDPSMDSEPKWISGGESFLFEPDGRHNGIFSVVSHRATILPDPSSSSFLSAFGYVTPGHVVVGSILDSAAITEFKGFSWPSLKEEIRFRLPGFSLDLATRSGKLLTTFRQTPALRSLVVEVDPQRGRARGLGQIPGQWIRSPLFVEDGLAFRSHRLSSEVWRRRPDGSRTPMEHQDMVTEAVACGDGMLTTTVLDDGSSIVRYDKLGRTTRLTRGWMDGSPTCAADGNRWFFVRGSGPEIGIHGCEGSRCRRLYPGAYGYISVSPDGSRLVLLAIANAGPVVQIMPTSGGQPRQLSAVETTCRPGWSSNTTVWISRRRTEGFVWTELDVDTGRETGRTVRGESSCSDARRDPASPVDAEVRVIYRETTEIRLVPFSQLEEYLKSTLRPLVPEPKTGTLRPVNGLVSCP